MDIVVIVIVLLGLAVLVLKKNDSFVYYIAIVDIFLRILDFIANNIDLDVISQFINNNFPNNLFDLVASYTDGIFTTVIFWVLVFLYTVFLARTISVFMKKK